MRTVCFLYLILCTSLQAVSTPISKLNKVYQFHVTISYNNAKSELKNTTAYLWIPEKCTKVKGVVIMAQNVLEQWLAEHTAIRKACAKESIAILWSCPSFFVDGRNHHPEINITTIERLLDSLAFMSGYTELRRVPWLPIGHSGTNNLVSMLVATKPHKIIAAIKMKGGPGFNTSTIPVLSTAGEYFEWNQHKEDLINPKQTIPNYQSIIKERTERQAPLSYFFDPNTGHFDCSEALTKHIAHYIMAACKARLNDVNDTALNLINMNEGWVAGLPLPGATLVKPKLYKNASAEERNLPWYFSKQQAEEAIRLASVNFGRKPQLVAFANAKGEPAGFTRGIVWPIPYTTNSDGITFNLYTTFLKAIPDTFLQKGTPLGHNNKQPQIVLLCGNAKQLKGNTFQLTPERSYKNSATYFIIRQEGNEEYRTSIQPGQLVLTPNAKGLAQHISFLPIDHVTASTKKIHLQATATSGMPVQFFVKSGPAWLNGNTLNFSTIPPKTKFPVKVTVIAYQWGRSVEPIINTAEFVEQTFYINH